MKKNYFLLEDFNALQKHLETLRADLKKLGGQMQAALTKSSVMDGDSMSNAISELFEQQQEKIRDLEKLTINPQILPVLRDAQNVAIGAYLQIKNCDTHLSKWYHIRGVWFKPEEEEKTGETIETAIPLSCSSPLILRCIGKTAPSTVLIRKPDDTFYYIEIENISAGARTAQTH